MAGRNVDAGESILFLLRCQTVALGGCPYLYSVSNGYKENVACALAVWEARFKQIVVPPSDF